MSQLPDVQTVDSYGGIKVDAYPVVDPETTESAAEHNALTADVAALSRMSPRAMVRFVGASVGSPTDPVSGLIHEAMWGHALAVKPVVTATVDGYLVTWPATVTNELGEDVLLSIRWARTSYESIPSTPAYILSHRVTAPNAVEVFCRDAAGVANRANGTVLAVDIY